MRKGAAASSQQGGEAASTVSIDRYGRAKPHPHNRRRSREYREYWPARTSKCGFTLSHSLNFTYDSPRSLNHVELIR
jgi:hypothetical protein